RRHDWLRSRRADEHLRHRRRLRAVRRCRLRQRTQGAGARLGRWPAPAHESEARLMTSPDQSNMASALPGAPGAAIPHWGPAPAEAIAHILSALPGADEWQIELLRAG